MIKVYFFSIEHHSICFFLFDSTQNIPNFLGPYTEKIVFGVIEPLASGIKGQRGEETITQVADVAVGSGAGEFKLFDQSRGIWVLVVFEQNQTQFLSSFHYNYQLSFWNLRKYFLKFLRLNLVVL